MEDDEEFEPIFRFLRWEIWPWTDDFRWMVTHDRLMICEWRRRGGLFVYWSNLKSRLRRVTNPSGR